MDYNSDFHDFQNDYVHKFPNALFLRNYLPSIKDKNILDIGCGSGIDLQYFKTLSPKIISGIDISDELVLIAKKNLPEAEIKVGTFLSLPWQENFFDVVYSKYALNHAEDIILPLKEIFRVSKDDSTILLQVTHPIRSLKYLKSQDYFDEKSIIKYPIDNGKEILEPHHTISSWINAVYESGFIITHCEEILNKPKEEYKEVITPSALIFILKKLK